MLYQSLPPFRTRENEAVSGCRHLCGGRLDVGTNHGHGVTGLDVGGWGFHAGGRHEIWTGMFPPQECNAHICDPSQ